MSFQEAWEAYNSGNFSRAAKLFEARTGDDYPGAMTGLIRTYLAQDDGATAEDLAQRLVDFNATPQAVALLGEVIGSEGRRKEAEEYLKIAAEQAPQDGFIRVVLGEQRIRRGKWDAGAQDFVAGLSARNRQGQALAHVQGVLEHLIEALIDGKIRDADAMKFVNQIAYNVPDASQEMNFLFAAARRSIGERVPLTLGARSQPSPPTRNAVARQPTQRQQSQRQQSAPQRRQSAPPPMAASSQPARQKPVSRKNTDLVQLIRRDRRQNEKLQETVLSVGLPAWPSGKTVLDELPNIRPELLGREISEMKKPTSVINDGSIASEIIIRRGFETIIQRASNGGRPPDLGVRGVARLEVMCWDGLVGGLPEIPHVYQIEGELPMSLLALGAYLGISVEKRHDAVWRFSKNPLESMIELPHKTFRPFALAQRWLAASDKDTVDLVEEMAEVSADNTAVLAHLDTTEGLSERALKLRLAELWASYRWKADDDAMFDVAQTVEPILDHERAVVFAIDHRYAPAMARGAGNAALRSDGKVVLAYVRGTGDFLVASSRKHLAMLISILFGRIDSEKMPAVVQAIRLFHRPNKAIVESGAESERPHWVKFKGGGQGIRFVLNGHGGEERLQFLYSPNSHTPWRLDAQ